MYECYNPIIIQPEPTQEIPIEGNATQEVIIEDDASPDIVIEEDNSPDIIIDDGNDGDIPVEDGNPVILGGTINRIIPFTKDDFRRVGNLERWYIAIPERIHKLKNPFVKKIVLTKSDVEEETPTFMTPIICGERLLTTGTIKVYITIDLTKCTIYDGKIYLEGEY